MLILFRETSSRSKVSQIATVTLFQMFLDN